MQGAGSASGCPPQLVVFGAKTPFLHALFGRRGLPRPSPSSWPFVAEGARDAEPGGLEGAGSKLLGPEGRGGSLLLVEWGSLRVMLILSPH